MRWLPPIVTVLLSVGLVFFLASCLRQAPANRPGPDTSPSCERASEPSPKSPRTGETAERGIRVIELGKVFRLRPKETVQLLDQPVCITLEEIVDSRCPGPPVQCPWEGEIGAKLVVAWPENHKKELVYLGTVTARQERVANLILELKPSFPPVGPVDEVEVIVRTVD